MLRCVSNLTTIRAENRRRVRLRVAERCRTLSTREAARHARRPAHISLIRLSIGEIRPTSFWSGFPTCSSLRRDFLSSLSGNRTVGWPGQAAGSDRLGWRLHRCSGRTSDTGLRPELCELPHADVSGEQQQTTCWPQVLGRLHAEN